MINSETQKDGPDEDSGFAALSSYNKYHLTENYYIINSETIMDVNNYILFSIINSQTIDVM